MRFVTFEHDRRIRAGVVCRDGDSILDLAHPSVTPALNGLAPALPALIAHGLPEVARCIAAQSFSDALVDRADARLLAPIIPGRILAVAFNFSCALAERNMKAPEKPVVFEKDARTIIGPDEPVVLPAGIGGVTYEAELAVVVGRGGANIPCQEADGYIAGYTIFNDISASDVIRRENSFDRGKNFPTFGPLGPAIVVPSRTGSMNRLSLGLNMDGRTLQKGSTENLLFGVAELVSMLSRQWTLKPGDLIATGTPAGVAAMHTPPAWLRGGSRMQAWVEGIGTLSNPIIEGFGLHD